MTAERARGTRDFLPEQMHDRLFVIETLARVYRQHGFEPLDTPAFERIETLMGKYGEEGDKLIFKILKRGKGGERGEVDQALRYDLTVPLARVVANEHPRMPFKRYHMGPVWRADRPGRGRYREFWQCDVDICGTESTLAEAECLAVFSRALRSVGFGDVVLRLNDRRLLRALARHLGALDNETDLLVAVDKLDKIGVEGVNKELDKRGLAHVIDGLWPVLQGDDDPLERMARLLGDQPETAEAIADLRNVLRDAELLGVPSGQVQVDPTLARGLDYYTGPIWEAVLPGENMGSLGGGGRYDGLIGMFGKTDVPAVGCSIGLERILQLREEGGTRVDRTTSAPVLITIFDSETREQSIVAAKAFRDAGVGADLYPEARKLKSQLKHADALGYPFVCVIGPGEIKAGTVQIKELKSGEQQSLSLEDAIEHVRAAPIA